MYEGGRNRDKNDGFNQDITYRRLVPLFRHGNPCIVYIHKFTNCSTMCIHCSMMYGVCKFFM